MAARVGTAATPSMVAAQLFRIRETWQQEVWARTGRVQLASAFLCSLFSGKWIPMGEAEACATGMWVHGAGSGSPGHWDEGVLDIVGGSREEGRRVRGWLGEVDTSGGGRRAGNVSRYLVERYRFDPGVYISCKAIPLAKLLGLQTRSWPPSHLTTWQLIFPFVHPPMMQYYLSVQWICYLRPHNIICLHVCIIYSPILLKTPVKNGGTSQFSVAGRLPLFTTPPFRAQ